MSASLAVKPQSEEKRREKRLHVAVRIRIGTKEALTDAELAVTYEISLSGARVSGSPTFPVGSVVWVQRLTKRARYKVIWVGEAGTPQTQQAGLECLEPEKSIWEEELRQKLMG